MDYDSYDDFGYDYNEDDWGGNDWDDDVYWDDGEFDNYDEAVDYPDIYRASWRDKLRSRWQGLKAWWRDPGCILRRCDECHRRGCMPGERFCEYDLVPF